MQTILDQGWYTCVATDNYRHRSLAAAHLTVESGEIRYANGSNRFHLFLDIDDNSVLLTAIAPSLLHNDDQQTIVNEKGSVRDGSNSAERMSTIAISTPRAFLTGQNVRVQWSVLYEDTQQIIENGGDDTSESSIAAFKVEFKRDDPHAEWITGDQLEAHVRAYTVHQLPAGHRYIYTIRFVYLFSI